MTVRAVFFEADDTRAVAARLRRDGFEATVARERFAGEDDDEDHPWAVVTDAPAVMVELLLEAYDGWLHDPTDAAAGAPPTPAPLLPLPDAPRRTQGRPGGP